MPELGHGFMTVPSKLVVLQLPFSYFLGESLSWA